MADLEAQQLGKYRLLRLIARGTFGEVYEAEQLSAQHKHAIRVLPEACFRTPARLERFVQEAHLLTTLEHPHLVPVEQVSSDSNRALLVMPLLGGGTLHDLLAGPGRPLRQEDVGRYLAEMCAAVDYAHSQQVVHLHLKPQNVLLSQDGQVHVSGFGLAHLLEQPSLPRDHPRALHGALYRAPEQMRNVYDWRGDLYSLAVLLYQMLTGRPPFEGATWDEIVIKHLAETPPPLTKSRPDLPLALEKVLNKALAKQPEQRYQSAAQLLEAFQAASALPKSRAASYPPQPPSPRPPAPETLVNHQLGNYRLLRKIGEGNFADVYLGRHVNLGTSAAVKVMRTRLLPEEAYTFFHEEAKLLVDLRHQHIVRFFDYGVDAQNTPYLIMEYAPLGYVRPPAGEGRPMPLPLIVTYVQQVAEALRYIHEEKRLVHRDLKPQNLLLRADGLLLLSDFGLTTIIQSSARSQPSGTMAGTNAYIAPEQIKGRPRAASDQYALGVITYEWLTGLRPFSGTAEETIAQHLAADPPPLSSILPGIPPAVEEAVLKALAKDYKQRFANVSAFAEALEQAAHL